MSMMEKNKDCSFPEAKQGMYFEAEVMNYIKYCCSVE